MSGDFILGSVAMIVGGFATIVGVCHEHAVVVLWVPGLTVALFGWRLRNRAR